MSPTRSARTPTWWRSCETLEDDDFLDEMGELVGGLEARAAIEAFLDRTACAAPVRSTSPGRGGANNRTPRPHHPRQHPELRARCRAARASSRDGRKRLPRRARSWSACERCRTANPRRTRPKQMIDRVRTFMGYREYPKYGMVSRYFVYKQALMAEAGRLVHARVLREQRRPLLSHVPGAPRRRARRTRWTPS